MKQIYLTVSDDLGSKLKEISDEKELTVVALVRLVLKEFTKKECAL